MVATFFFFNDTATTEIYTLSLHDALPISPEHPQAPDQPAGAGGLAMADLGRSEEHTSELQSQSNLVCRLLLEKKKKTIEARDLSLILSAVPPCLSYARYPTRCVPYSHAAT